jgi:hypothetical protein
MSPESQLLRHVAQEKAFSRHYWAAIRGLGLHGGRFRDSVDTTLVRPLVACPGRPERTAMVLVFMVVIAARLPNVALHGRVWAEEGAVFLGNAAVLPWSQAIFHPVGGYLNLIANLAGIVAFHAVPLERVRWVGVVTGLLFQAIPAVLIVSSGFDWLQTRLSLVVALLLIATVPLAEEVWLNSLHPQFHLALCAALILAMDPVGGWNGRFRNLLILLGALSGPTTWFLLPLFVARAAIDRSRPRALQAAVLAAGLLLQVAFWLQIEQTNSAPFNLSGLICAFFVRTLLIPWLDYRSAGAMAGGLLNLAATGTVPVALAFAEVLITCFVGVLLWQRGRDAGFWMFVAAIVIAVPSYAAARGGTLDFMHIEAHGRYAFVPQVLIALVVLRVAVTGKDWISISARVGVVWLLAIGISEFHARGTFDEGGPRWADEVAAWRQDPTHVLRIWPGGWTIDPNVLALVVRP